MSQESNSTNYCTKKNKLNYLSHKFVHHVLKERETYEYIYLWM